MVKSAEDSGEFSDVTGSAFTLAKLYAITNVGMADAAIDGWREKCATIARDCVEPVHWMSALHRYSNLALVAIA